MKNKLTGELAICGYNAVKALCSLHPERVNRLYFSADRSKAFGDICKDMARRHKLYRLVDDAELAKLSQSEHHQGVVAMALEPPIPAATGADVETWIGEGRPLLILEDVGNSHNLGAIVRSAAFFGIGRILLADSGKASGVTTSAYRVAEGGFEHVALHRCSDLSLLFAPFRNRFPLLGADQTGARDLFAAGALPAPGGAYGLIMGNEEAGLSSSARKACSWTVRIPGTDAVESLNVAQAAAVLMSRMAQQLLPRS